MDSLFGNVTQHLGLVLTGATALSFVGHAVNTFPTPTNPYGAWLLGCIQFLVGQRVAAKNTFRGEDTAAIGVPKDKP